MGATRPRQRCFSMRSTFTRALILTLAMMSIGAFFLEVDLDVRAALARTAASAREAMTFQKPIGGANSNGWEQASAGATALAILPAASRNMTCDYDTVRLRRWQTLYGLQESFEYTKRYLQVTRQDIPRKPITELAQSFLVDSARVVDVNKQYQPDICPEPLVVPVSKSPFPSTANASDFMFGVSTTYQRFTDPRTSPINEWSYWLTDGRGNSNGGKMVLKLLDATPDDLQEARAKLTSTGIDVDVYGADASLPMAVRYLGLAPALYDHPDRSSRKWLVVCDDDTFFPSLHALVDKLAEYDHTRPLYIGALSEDVNNIQRHGSQAFGGAGVFLSVPMAKVVAEKYESCRAETKIAEANTGWGPQGDILLRKCIYENSEVRLTLLSDLWQLDLFGDPSGFYESGIRPLSLHHYRGGIWHVAHPWHYTKVARVCGEDCTLQRFRTADDFVISNGFSVAYYPRGIDFDLGQVEATFRPAPDNKGWNFDFAFGPQRQALHKTGRKISWDLQEATVHDDGTVSQVYVCKHDDWRWKHLDGSPMADRDGIIELVWMPDTADGSNQA